MSHVGMPGARLTARQAAVLEYIREVRRDRGRSPSFAEIMTRFGFVSKQGVTDHVLALVRKGALLPYANRTHHCLLPADDPPATATMPAGWESAGLSPRQWDTLRAIVAHRVARGVAPTVRELATALGVTQTAVVGFVEALVRKGVLARESGRARSLVPVARAEAPR